MKKNYFFLLLLSTFMFGFSQTIVTIDRANITGPTNSDNITSISSVGLTRGSGVNLSTTSPNFTANNWTIGGDQATAEAANDYIEWSVSANTSFDVAVDEIDIRLRRNSVGPTSWQLFYSLDNFATAGLALNTPDTVPTSTSNFNLTGLGITTGDSGTITFRLYAWGATTTGGWLRLREEISWAGALGIPFPGIRLIGSVSSTSSNSAESDITISAFDPTDNIDYTSYLATSGLTTTNSIQIGQFIIRDGGNDFTDTDLFGTTLTDIGFNISNFSNLEAIAIFDGSSNVGEASVNGATVNINGLNSGVGISSSDGSPKSFDVYATFKTDVIDNEQIQLTIDSAIADISGSAFSASNAGGPQTPNIGDDNRIEVVASGIEFDQQPSDTFQFEIMTPFPTIIATDNNGNQDLDYNDNFNVISSGSLTPSPIVYTMTNGMATFDTIIFTEEETVATLLAFSSGFFAASNSFEVGGPLITIAIQDFDGSTPEWVYSTDVTTFDNGWGTDGYYGVIDSAIAAPLDNASFSGNIFGEHDLNDEGDNGTTGFATLTFDTIDISAFNDVRLTFDWDVHGYVNNADDAQYTLIYDGVSEPLVFLLDGNGAIDTDEGTVSIDIPNTVTTIALQISVRDNGADGFSGFDNFKLISEFSGLVYTDVDGWKDNIEPDETTGSDNALVIDGTYDVSGNVELDNLIIKNSASVIVDFGESIIINSNIINDGSLELNSISNSYSSLIINGSINSEIVYNRHVNQFASTGSSTGNNDLISAPVTNTDQTFIPFRTANPDIPFGTIGGVPSFLFGPFDNNANTYVNYTDTDNPLIESGIGYRTASLMPTGSPLSFTGDVETGSVSVPITVGTGSIFNLVGNPYPSYINLSDFLAANTTEFDPGFSGVYGYDGSATDGYTIWNQAYSDANPTAVITPGQGFLIASVTGGGTISFTPSMRSIGTTDDFIAGRNSDTTPTNAFLNLELTSDVSSYKTDLYFNENASLGMDSGYDAIIFNSETPNFAVYSHLVENNTGKNMAVQSVNYDALDNVTIPLGVNANQGEQITFSIANTNISEDISIILEDNLNNTFTDLRNTDYSIIPSTALLNTGRFYIHFSSQQLSVTEDILNGLDIYTTDNPRQIVIKGQLESTTNIQVIDIQGRVVSSAQLNTNDTSHSINVSNLASGVYIVQLQNNNATRTQKIILK